MTNSNTETTHLTADHITDGWTVVDDRGGRWYPADEALAEIENSEDPEATTLAMCIAEPMRGVWHD